MKYYLIAGEAPGDLHASRLMKEIKENDPQATFRFFGGDLMQKEGGEMVKHYRDLAYMGFVAVIANFRTIMNNMRLCKEDIKKFSPDVVILIDYPGFNLKIAEYVKKNLNIPVYYYISPKIWAWKEYRIKSIKKYIDKMFCILPFETDFYNKHNYKVEYVGNPTLDELYHLVETPIDKTTFLKENNLTEKPVIAILAGSLKAEVKQNLPMILEALKEFPQYQPVIAGAPGLDPQFYDSVLQGTDMKIVFGKTYDLLQSSEFAIVTSGTSTLETAILNVPQVVCYYVRGGKIFYDIMDYILKIPYVSLVNLVADAPVVTELLGYKFTKEALVEEIKKIMPGGDQRNEMFKAYDEVRRRLGEPGAPVHAAKIIVDSLKK